MRLLYRPLDARDRGRPYLDKLVYADTLTAPADSAVSLHYRGLAVTSGAILGTAIASPGFVRRADRTPGGIQLPRTTAWRNDDPAVFMDAILALDNATLIAMGDPLDGCLTVIRSDDGGRSWETVPCADSTRAGVPASREGEAAFAPTATWPQQATPCGCSPAEAPRGSTAAWTAAGPGPPSTPHSNKAAR